MAADGAALLSLVEEFVSGLQDSKAKDAATGVRDGQFTILQLVEALGLSLTSSQPHTRARGVQLLSEVLQDCYGNLTEREVEVLIAFYENRLKDHFVITPHVLNGLRALSTVLPPGSAVSMLRSLFQDIPVQSLKMEERSYVYNMLISLMESREAELKGLGADFVFGFVQSMDGERDPRNLLLAFQIANNIIRRSYDLGTFTEELFEVTSCYFPIDFTPPPNDPHGITKEELIQALRAVLTGTPKFAEFLLPLIIEKLDSDVQSAKLDSLQTLTACVSQYEHKDLAEFLEGLWASLRREVFQTSSEKIESAGLTALTALTSCLSRSVLNSDSEDSLRTFLDLVLNDCKHHLCEPDLKLVWPSAKLLQAACSASTRASHIVTAAVMPSLIEQYSSRTQVPQKHQHRSVCCVFLRIDLWLFDNELLWNQDVAVPLYLCRVSACSLAVVECAGALAQLYPAAFITKLIPRLKKEMFSEPMEQDNRREPSELHSHNAVRQRCLSALAAVSKQPSVVLESTPVLLERQGHFLLLLGSASFSVEEVVLACRSLQRIAEQVQDTEKTGRCFHDIIIPRLLSLALQAALQGMHQIFSVSKVCLVSYVAFNVIRLAGQTASRAVSLFLDGDVSFLPDNSFPSHIQLLKQQGDSWSQSQMVCLLMGCMCSLPCSVEVPQVDQLLSQLEEMSCTCSHPLSYTAAAKCFAGLVNKRPLGQCLDCTTSAVRTQAFTLLIWVAKALLLRYHPLSTALTDKLFSLLDDAELGATAANGFSLLMSDSVDVLNRSYHADVRIMYRQRFFSENSAKLVQGFNAAPQEKKPNYLKALSNIVNKLPKQVQVTELPALLSLLLEALSCPDQGVQLSTLSCLEPVLIDPPLALIHKNKLKKRKTEHLSLFQILPFRARVLQALAPPLDDRKRLVRSEAVQARGEWFLVGSPGGR
uniref:MMS19 nucleotide excision repair protein n=1 Tax=Mastacembelus armatus TaxID=205130 RepID=A0A7N8WVS0_9TELE